ncbi:MAG: VOC family protein [Bdellovibrionaceae bacterium]|nr:VOC family protein [Pseudobdellovibrionaceae bacterium]
MKTFDFISFKNDGEIFLNELTAELTEKGIQVGILPCDHLCFRVEDLDEYNFYKDTLACHGKLLTEALVNGRAISTFSLNSPFKTSNHEVSLIELPSPKPGTPYETGFEHAEFVIKDDFKQFSARHPNLSFLESGNRTLNPELCLRLDNGKQAKFHHSSLDRVIEIEEASVKDIIFDFDGTLIKSRENIYEINRIVFSKVLERDVTLQESIDKFHPEFPKLFEVYAVSCPVKQKEALTTWGLVAETFPYELFEDVLETLTWIRGQSFRLHLWTARDEYSARKILKAHGIEHFFTTLSFATDIDSKPHVNSLRFDWKSAGKNQVIMIGDSPSDIFGAKNINAICGAALWDPYSNRNSLTTVGAELFFHKLVDFKNWLNREEYS